MDLTILVPLLVVLAGLICATPQKTTGKSRC